MNNKRKRAAFITKMALLSGIPYRDRTCNLPLGGACYIHLTKETKCKFLDEILDKVREKKENTFSLRVYKRVYATLF